MSSCENNNQSAQTLRIDSVDKLEMKSSNEQYVSRMINIIRGYQLSQAIYVMAQLGIADLLGKTGSKSLFELATMTGTHPMALQRLLRTLACTEVVTEIENDHFILAPLGECLQTNVVHSLHASAIMWSHPILWQSYGQLEHTIRTGQTAFDAHFGMNFFDYQKKHDPSFCTIYNACMNNSSRHVEIINGYATGFANAKHVIDVGGGLGAFLCVALTQFSHLHGTLYDLPHVVADAHTMKNNEQCSVVAGDMFESVPSGADIYVLSHVLMDHNDEKVRIILKNCYQAMHMTKTARLLIVDIVLNNRNTSIDQIGRLSDLTMLVLTGGRHRSEEDLYRLIESEHFVITSNIPLAGVDNIIECVPV